MTDFNAAAVTHVLSTAGEIIIIASKRIRLGLLHALTSSALQRTGAALELECLRQSRFSVRAKLNTLGLKKTRLHFSPQPDLPRQFTHTTSRRPKKVLTTPLVGDVDRARKKRVVYISYTAWTSDCCFFPSWRPSRC
jgi:hypothetical protein